MAQDSVFWAPMQREFRARQIACPRVVVHGGYGKHNLGDDAILEAILNHLENLWPTAVISILCHDPQPVQSVHPFVRAYSFKDPRALRAICSADLYIIGGGGIVNRINTYSGFGRLKALDPKGKFLFLAGWLSKLCGARLVFYSVGTTSVPDKVVAWLTRLVVNRADSVSVRDPLSKTVLQGLGVTGEVLVLPDPATTLRPAAPERAIEILKGIGIDLKRPLVGISMRYTHDPEVDNRDILCQAVRVVAWLIESKNVQVLFLPFGRHPYKKVENDLAFARELQAHLATDHDFWILEQEHRPTEVQAILARMEAAILERLHACVLATAVETPVIAIVYDAKVSEFMKQSTQGSHCIPLVDFTLERVQATWQALGLESGLKPEDRRR